MDSEIFASERAHHRRFRLIYRSLAGLLMCGAGVGIVIAAFHTSQRASWITLAGVVLITITVVGVALWTDRPKADSLVSRGPWSFGQVYSREPQKAIWNAMGKILVANEMGFTRLTSSSAMSERPGTMLYRKGVHLIDVRASTDHPGWRVITVFSSPDLPTTITDFGRGANINQDLLTAVPKYVAPAEVNS